MKEFVVRKSEVMMKTMNKNVSSVCLVYSVFLASLLAFSFSVFFSCRTSGQFVKIALRSNPTTGANWICTFENPEIAEVYEDSYKQDDAPEGFVGVGGIQTLTLKCLKPGETEVVLTYGQQWNGGDIFETRKAILSVDENLNGSLKFEQ